MVSLLLLSMALSTPTTAAQPGVVPGDPLVVESPPIVLVQPELPAIVEEPQSESFDAMAIHPEMAICYKIRAYIFSKGSNPKLLRETTCGPSRAATKRTDGEELQLVPLDVKGSPTALPQK
jgi:hypothetical protein